jgi:hypothetical protein
MPTAHCARRHGVPLDLVRITEADLRHAIADPAYSNPRDPGRAALGAWVAEGFRALSPADGPARDAVWVRPHIRDGKPVAGHWRQAAAGAGGGAARGGATGGTRSPDVIEAGVFRWLERIRRQNDGRGGRPPSPQSGRRPREHRWRDPADPQGHDNVHDLRSDPQTRAAGRVGQDIDQWDRPGGERQRDLDLQRLGSVERRTPPNRPEIEVHTLRDGRTAIVRRNTRADNPITLEIQEPNLDPTKQNVATDKFRYR